MARTATKKKVTTTPHRRNGKLQGPSFDNWENLSSQDFHKLRRAASDFYYQNYKPVDLYPYLWRWMKENGYDKNQVAAVKNAKLTPIPAVYAKLMIDGCPDYNEKYAKWWESLPGTSGKMKPMSEFVHARIEEYIVEGSVAVEEEKQEVNNKKNVYVPTIQERLRDQACEMAEDISEWLEGWVRNPSTFDAKSFDFKAHFQKKGVTQAHARKLKSFYENELADFDELERMPTVGQLKKMDEREADLWEQLKEGYGHFKKADIKKLRTAVQELMTALDFVIESAKAVRKPRKAKPKSASKLVEKLKYCKTDDKYKLASISPDQIVGANELWVFNVKTRKLGKYVAAVIDPKGMGRDGSGLGVKGTTIIGFDPEQSVQKTLRKPEEQLKAFKAAGKVALRKFLDEVATTDTKLNGRCNPDTVLLKVA